MEHVNFSPEIAKIHVENWKICIEFSKFKIVLIAKMEVCKADPDAFHSKSCELVGAIAKVIQPVNFSKPASMEKMWENILKVIRDQSVCSIWEVTLAECKSNSDCTFTSLHYFLVMEVVKYIMKFENSRSSNRKDCDRVKQS